MRISSWCRGAFIALIFACFAAAQLPPQPPPGFYPRPMPPAAPPPQQQQPQRTPPVTPANPTAPGTTAAPANPASPQAPGTTTPAQAPPAGAPATYGGLSLNNVSLTEVIDLLAHQLKINYILDKRVQGGVMLNTYGETKDVDTRSLLETILRINGFGMVKQGDLFRIVPLAEISHQPISAERKSEAGSIPEDDQTMLNLVFLKYVSSSELMKVLTPFIGENASIYEYPPANLLLVLDSHRNMRRLMDLVSMFDSDALANQRVRVFEVKHGRPSDLSKELEGIVKAISLSDKAAPIKFLPIDRINSIIAVAPNPGAFAEVQKWLDKLDTPVKLAAGAVSNYVYRVRYGDAQSIGCSIQALYGQLSSNGYQSSMSIAACAAMGSGFGGGQFGGGQFGGGQFGGGQFGGGQFGGGGFGGGGFGGGGYPGGYGGGYGAYPGGYGGGYPPYTPVTGMTTPLAAAGPATPGAATTDLTGQYLGNALTPGSAGAHVPRVIANPLNNTLLIQASPQEYESILQLLKDLDIPPRQVLIEAKIYSVDISHAFSSDVIAKLALVSGNTGGNTPHTFLSDFGKGVTNFSTATLVGKSRELLAAVQMQETENRAKVLSAPSVIATDSIAASINAGTDVPTLTASAVTGVQSGGNSLFANSVSNRSTGVTLNVMARVTPSGIVTLLINQEVSAPAQTTTSGIQSPSFDKKSIQTQITVQDGDTIAIGGIIDEKNSVASSGIPGLHRLPLIGAAFGSRSYSKARSELIIFITPHVIYDTNQLLDASDELKGRLKMLRKDVKE